MLKTVELFILISMDKSDLIMAFPIAMKTMFKGQKGQKLNLVRLRTTDFLVALNLTKF